MIPQQTIDQVAAANPILDVIGGQVLLKPAGSMHRGLCPFHQGASPSLIVNPARQIFRCFGCGAGGSVFRFVELHDGLSFADAVLKLADKAGILIAEEPQTQNIYDR